MWKDDDPPKDPRWLNILFAVFGTLYGVALFLNICITIVSMFR